MGAGKIFKTLSRLMRTVHSALPARENHERPESGGAAFRPGQETPGRILFHDGNGVLRLAVRPADLICIESAGNYAVVRYAPGGGRPVRHPVRCPLHVLEARFAGTSLVRCRRGCIVNMDKVLSARKGEDGYVLELETGPVSVTRTYESRVLAALDANRL